VRHWHGLDPQPEAYPECSAVYSAFTLATQWHHLVECPFKWIDPADTPLVGGKTPWAHAWRSPLQVVSPAGSLEDTRTHHWLGAHAALLWVSRL
jgi:hypothetical protein